MLTFHLMKPQELYACSELAANAFADYDYFSLYIPEQKKRENCLKHMLYANFRASRHNSIFFTAKKEHQLVAVAQLSRPYAPAPAKLQYLKAGFWKVLLQGGWEPILAWYKTDCDAEKPCLTLPGNTWFLRVLTVDPMQKSQGIGSKMLQSCIIPYVKGANGETLCLFTNSEANRIFYQKNGFVEFHAQQFSYHGSSVGSWSYRMSL